MTNGKRQMTNEFPKTNDKLKIWHLSLIWILSFGFCHSGFGAITGKLKKGRSIGQSILEYAVLLSVVAAAMIAMSFYIKRAVQGRINAIDQQIEARANQSPTIWVVPI